MKAIFELLAMFSLKYIFGWANLLFKKYILSAYINLVEHVRGLFFIGLLTLFCLILFLSGFLFLHIGLFLIIPWSIADKACLMLLIATVYILISLFLLSYIHSKGHWLKISGIKKVLEDLSSKD